MTEAISTASAVLALAAAAWESAKYLHEEISRLRGWPATLRDLRSNLDTLQGIINPDFLRSIGIQDTINQDNSPPPLAPCLRSLGSVLNDLNNECKAFRAHLDAATTRSTGEERLNTFDRFSLQFKEGTIKTFKSGLEAHKLTVNLALGAVSSVLGTENQAGIESIQKAIISTKHDIQGQFDGLTLAIEALRFAQQTDQNDEIIKLLEGHEYVLSRCQEYSEAIGKAIAETDKAWIVGKMNLDTGGTVDFMGNIGDVRKPSKGVVQIGSVDVKGQAASRFTGDIGGDAATAFINAMYGQSKKHITGPPSGG